MIRGTILEFNLKFDLRQVFTAALDLELQEEWSESEERLQSWSK